MMPPLSQRRIVHHFILVGCLILAPIVEGVLLVLASAAELVAENLLECILPRNPVAREALAPRKAEKNRKKK